MNIKALRKKANLTQTELAECLGVTQTCVGKWETADANPRASLLPKLTKVLNCTLDDLYAKED